jgi:nucleoside-diphosphate-sugar epimerase
MNRVLVTGSAGFIGTHLVKMLKKSGYTVFELGTHVGDVTDSATWEKFPATDIVIHLAAKSFVPESWNNIPHYINCNVLGTTEALNYCRKHNAKLIFLSSYMYGNPEKLPIPETSALAVNNPYALSKKMAEEVCKFYSDNFNIPVVIFRPFNIYGINQAEHFLIPTLIKQVFENNEVRIKDLEPKRDYVYIDDLVSAIIKAINYDGLFAIFNIGSGMSYSVKYLIDTILHISGKNLAVISDKDRRKGEIMDCIADISLAKKELNWQPSFSLEEGIEAIIKERDIVRNV